jgi:hypothetical protein
MSNPDLFISLVDGRNPTVDDYDLSSTMIGADSIRISADDPIWNLKGWHHPSAVLVVVGVRAMANTDYHITLVKPSSPLY